MTPELWTAEWILLYVVLPMAASFIVTTFILRR